MNRKSKAGRKNRAPTALVRPIPKEIQELLGAPPLLASEDEKLYDLMLASIADSIGPTDFITWLLIRDLADHRIEIARYRRFKMGVIQLAGNDSVHKLLPEVQRRADNNASILKEQAEKEIQTLTSSNKTSAEIEQQKQEINNRVAVAVGKAAATIHHLSGPCDTEGDFVNQIDVWIGKHERIDNLLRAAEDRFTATLEELDRHVRGLGTFVREKWDIIEGELADSPEPDPPSSILSSAANPRRIRTRQTPSAQMIGDSGAPQKRPRRARGNR